MSKAVLSLGANLGDRLRTLREALAGIGPALVRASSTYETPPWGDTDQPAYANAVAIVDDPAVDAHGWLTLAQRLENSAGRVRDPDRRFGPRTLDVDVIAVWSDGVPVVQDDPALILPHPRAHLRAFVLVPWLEIDPAAELPGHGPVSGLLDGLADDIAGIHKLA
ncbi:2-amino-4-hydroxy-6-hydroxymethyldihydropteridine diphosphokinase [Fodinicola acaciae]|uniref:2-amino-4-hydroxy-6- hydroxymethyldihydropteridine diphosphokinase n=1 Tax=Fodinicola acaciae TaxID=2681555 RepID=UPI0013D20048|nr:2-amino-4-hydroxy-6-hydroxymethyldihydropteridine diphosphokinase [Fodinicola acaciae]